MVWMNFGEDTGFEGFLTFDFFSHIFRFTCLPERWNTLGLYVSNKQSEHSETTMLCGKSSQFHMFQPSQARRLTCEWRSHHGLRRHDLEKNQGNQLTAKTDTLDVWPQVTCLGHVYMLDPLQLSPPRHPGAAMNSLCCTMPAFLTPKLWVLQNG